MARKTAVPPNQLERLKDLYSQQRAALVELAAAEDGVSSAEQSLAAAAQGLKDAQVGAEKAFQALVGLMGSAAAAELTGRHVNGKRANNRKPRDAETKGPQLPSLAASRVGEGR